MLSLGKLSQSFWNIRKDLWLRFREVVVKQTYAHSGTSSYPFCVR